MRPRRQRRPTPCYHRRPIGDDEEYVAFRLVHSSDRESDAFLNSLKSRSALDLPPRRHIGETAELASGISAYRTREQAISTGRTALERGRDLGRFVAELRLTSTCDIAEWGSPGHLTIWGDPLMLASQTTDIVSVGVEE